MKYIITGRNIEVTEGLKSAIYEKIGKLERYFTPDATVYVTLSVQKDRQKIAVTEKNSRPAITHFKVVERFDNYTLVSCR